MGKYFLDVIENELINVITTHTKPGLNNPTAVSDVIASLEACHEFVENLISSLCFSCTEAPTQTCDFRISIDHKGFATMIFDSIHQIGKDEIRDTMSISLDRNEQLYFVYFNLKNGVKTYMDLGRRSYTEGVLGIPDIIPEILLHKIYRKVDNDV